MTGQLAALPLAAVLFVAMAAGCGAVSAGQAVRSPGAAPCREERFEGSRFTVCGYHNGHDRIVLALKGQGGPLGGLQALESWLGPRAASVRFAMNAGMYHPGQIPVGLYVENGTLRNRADTKAGAGNFYALPNGVFSVDADGTPHVEETGAFLRRGGKPLWATQSGPLLLKGGALHPIATDRTRQAVRNGVATCGKGTAAFVISDDPVTLGRFARFFRDDLGCRDALYFDGAVSSLWDPRARRRDATTGLGPFVVVMR